MIMRTYTYDLINVGSFFQVEKMDKTITYMLCTDECMCLYHFKETDQAGRVITGGLEANATLKEISNLPNWVPCKRKEQP